MALRKCPICELNYIREGETVCHVCQKAKKHIDEVEDEVIMCIECGEYPVVSGHELCRDCLKEQQRQADLEILADKIRQDEVDEPLEEDIEEDVEDEE
ncbi:MAG: hypothetical protein PHT58_01780 [Eubacteriales bacterium]|nr:hypothetical protein [Eubacteriales bacterium]